MMQSYGARPPQEFEWQMGKTAASISFVLDAEDYLTNATDLDQVRVITDAIEKVKSGEQVLDAWLTPDEYLANPTF